MQLEIWSDVVCPWCYIGKRRLDAALASYPHADEVEVVYRSFELDPEAPAPAVERMVETLARKYGRGVDDARQMMEHVTGIAAQDGLEYHLDQTLRGNTGDAHRLLHLALAEGGPLLQGALAEGLMAAYFTQVQDLTDHAVLGTVAKQVGLDDARVRDVLASREYADAVRDDVDQARELGAGGVPFFVADRRVAVSGAQPTEVLVQLLERARTA